MRVPWLPTNVFLAVFVSLKTVLFHVISGRPTRSFPWVFNTTRFRAMSSSERRTYLIRLHFVDLHSSSLLITYNSDSFWGACWRKLKFGIRCPRSFSKFRNRLAVLRCNSIWKIAILSYLLAVMSARCCSTRWSLTCLRICPPNLIPSEEGTIVFIYKYFRPSIIHFCFCEFYTILRGCRGLMNGVFWWSGLFYVSQNIFWNVYLSLSVRNDQL